MAHEQTPVGSDTLGLLERIQQLQTTPLIPQSNPMLALGAILSGFSAGQQGQPNPVVGLLQNLRNHQIQSGLETARVQLSVDSARESARQHHVSEENTAQSRVIQRQEIALRLGKILVDEAATPEMAEAGYLKWKEAGLLPEAFSDPEYLKNTAKNLVARRELKENSTFLMAKALMLYEQDPSGALVNSDPELSRAAPNFQKMVMNPEGRALIQMMGKFEDPATYLVEQKTKKMTAEFTQTKVGAERELIALGGTPINLVDKTPEQLTTLALLYKNSGRPLPPTLEKYLGEREEVFNLGLRSKKSMVVIHEKEAELKTEAAALRKKTGAVEELGVFIEKLERLAKAAESARFATPDLKPELGKGISELAEEMKSLLAARLLQRATTTSAPTPKDQTDIQTLVEELRKKHIK